MSESRDTQEPPKKPGFFRRIFSRSQTSKNDTQDHATITQRFRRKLSVAPTLEKLILDSKITTDRDLAKLASKSLSVGIYAFLGISILGTLGVDTKPLVAGVGITGFTIGFALKEIATNFISGVMLMFQRPFEKGCTIKIHGGGGGIEGIVESIDIRYVILRLSNGGSVMIPSAIVYSNPITVSKSSTPEQSSLNKQ